MNSMCTERDNAEGKNNVHSYIKQEAANYGYDPSHYINYTTATPSATTLNHQQPLPGQPPLPPMPPPQGAVPPPPSAVYSPVPAQVAQIHPAAAAAAAAWSQWQWLTPPATPLPPPQPTAAFQRNNFVKRERYNHNRNNVYIPRGNFHKRNRRQRFDSQSSYEHAAAYYGGAAIGMDWQRNNEALIGHMQMAMQGHPPVSGSRRLDEQQDQDIKEEVVVKKSKQRKPMSQSYPSRPWNQEDAERALRVENEYNKSVKAQSLIIKFPDPDLNKDIVRKFHSGIQNIHFQSPSGPRYCFIQMSEGVDIDKAIKELEQIPFGIGHLKVERKSSRDEDNPTPEEIDPYTLYIGNLPESVNVNEVKSKFPTAARVDVGYAHKMRNTRYAFIRYNSINESISAYKQAHDLMWDTRSIIVRFRRQRGNTCLPGEQKASPKKLKEEAAKASVTNISGTEENEVVSNVTKNKSKLPQVINSQIQIHLAQSNVTESSTTVTSSLTPTKCNEQVEGNLQPRKSPTADVPLESGESSQEEETVLITEIKEEPIDYDDVYTGEDDDDDDDEIYHNYNNETDDDNSDFDDSLINFKSSFTENRPKTSDNDNIPSDHLDKMFSDLENIAGDIEL